FPPAAHEPGVLQGLQVEGQTRLRGVEHALQLAHTALAVGEQPHDLEPGLVRERVEPAGGPADVGNGGCGHDISNVSNYLALIYLTKRDFLMTLDHAVLTEDSSPTITLKGADLRRIVACVLDTYFRDEECGGFVRSQAPYITQRVLESALAIQDGTCSEKC